jgi:hypothetical protein
LPNYFLSTGATLSPPKLLEILALKGIEQPSSLRGFSRLKMSKRLLDPTLNLKLH